MDNLVNLITEYGLFLGVPLLFLAVVAWVYRPGSGKRYKKDGRIPFDAEDDGPASHPLK